MGTSPKITVIIVAYQGEKWLQGCLETLETAAKSQGDIRAVLVNNGTGNGIERIPSPSFEWKILDTEGSLGFAEANNYALCRDKPTTPAVCFLNQDTLGERGWLDACLRVLEEDSSLGAVSPEIRTWDGTAYDEGFLECVRGNREFREAEQTGAKGRKKFFVDRVSATAMIVRTEALRAAGPFDPIYGSYYEDYDFCLRLRKSGYRLTVSADGVVRHYGGSVTITEKNKRQRMRQILRNRTILRLREAGQHRCLTMLRQFFYEFPHRLARSAAGTTSAQPASVLLAAYLDLARIAPRLCSERRDKNMWWEYLADIGWEGARETQ